MREALMWSLGMVVDEPIDLAEGGVRGTRW
jgi:hypothetical protein